LQPDNQDVMVDGVEEFLQIHVHRDPPARVHIRLRSQYRVMRTPPWPKAVAMLAESGVQNRMQHSQKCLPNQPIDHRRDAQRALTTIGFWGRYPASEIMQMERTLDMMRIGQK